jgi:Peptidase family M1 domain
VVRLLLVLTCISLWAAPLAAQTQAREPDPTDALVRKFEQSLNAADRPGLIALFASSVPEQQLRQFTNDLLVTGAVRTTVRERDRAPLEGAPPGDGYSLIIEFFIETAGKARILTTGMDVRRPPGGDINSWRFVGAEGLTSVEGLYKIRVNTARPMTARNLEVTSEDLVIALQDGTVFLVECDDGVTGLVLIGRGEMRFSPTSAAERGQVRLFSGSDTLTSPIEEAFIRLSPSDYHKRVSTASLTAGAPQERLTRRALEIFSREANKSFNVDLQDLSSDTWHLLPPSDDFLAEVDTRRFDTLTYTRSSAQAEDVTVFRRKDRRTLALYPSVAKLAARGRFYSDDALRDYDVLDYSIDATIDPDKQSIQGRARLAIRVRSTSLSNVFLRLNEALTVTGVTSVEYGRLLYLRIRGQNNVLVNLPRQLPQDSDLTLVVSYEGRIPSQDLDVDVIDVSADEQEQGQGPPTEVTDPAFLLSNRAFWYPQNPVPDYATASLRIVVPSGWTCIASGQPVPSSSVVSLRDILRDGKLFEFKASEPLRYLAVVVARLTRVSETDVALPDALAASSGIDRLTVAVDAQSSQRFRGRAVAQQTEEILRFYASVVGDVPYKSATVALLESDLPGGHSPGYFAVIKNPLSPSNAAWRGDPATFEGFPEFFLAHELAHQWWGQAVGWKNYHEQWLSEGFAQYFAALYAQKTRGERTFIEMLRQFRRWSLSDSDQGPVHLGYRLGLVKGNVRVFRALVYNKGAAVLHMLRRLLGDDVFFSGLRRFYADRRYQKAGTEDLERALEAESGRVLDRFFERWIYGTDIPRVRYSTSLGDGTVNVRFEQAADLVFDLPVTVTLTYANGRTTDVVVPLTEAVVERSIPTTDLVRQVQVNRDSAAVAEFEERR